MSYYAILSIIQIAGLIAFISLTAYVYHTWGVSEAQSLNDSLEGPPEWLYEQKVRTYTVSLDSMDGTIIDVWGHCPECNEMALVTVTDADTDGTIDVQTAYQQWAYGLSTADQAFPKLSGANQLTLDDQVHWGCRTPKRPFTPLYNGDRDYETFIIEGDDVEEDGLTAERQRQYDLWLDGQEFSDEPF